MRIAEFNSEISRLVNEKTSRQVQVQTLVGEIKTLWDDLCTDLTNADEFDKAVRCYFYLFIFCLCLCIHSPIL